MKQSEELDTVLKKMNNGQFPWYFFYRSAKFHGLILLIAIAFTSLLYRYNIKADLKSNAQLQMQRTLGALNVLMSGSSVEQACKDIQELPFERIQLHSSTGKVICSSVQELSSSTISMPFITKQINLQLAEGQYALIYSMPQEKISERVSVIDGSFLTLLIPLSLIIYLIILIFVLNTSKPLRALMNQVEKFEMSLPHSSKLKLFYKKNEWAQIEAAFKTAEESIDSQLKVIKNENEKIKTLLESISDAIIAVDPYLNALFYNSHFKNIFLGHQEAKITSQEKLWKIFKQDLVLKFEEVTHTGRAVKYKDFIYSNDFEVIHFDVAIAPLHSNENEVVGAVGIFHDVSEAKLTEQMRVDFVANVSHEMRTPLTSIKGYSQILSTQLKDRVGEETKEYLDKILFNTERLISLFNDLLNLSVIESQNKMLIEDIDLEELSTSLVHGLETIYKHKKLKFNVAVYDSHIKADRKLISQAISNLLDNACKYTYENGEITLTASHYNNDAIIVISDQGPGIPKEHQKRIFERFYRIENSRDRKTGGTGLGLSIVKHIISKHKGHIWVESSKEKGTHFYIKIPLEKVL